MRRARAAGSNLGRARVGALAAVAVLGGMLTAGCVSPRNTLGTASSPCFRAVPVASEAVKDRGTLAGIRLVGLNELERHAEILDALEARAGHRLNSLCVASFHGRYTPGDVERPIGAAPPGGSGPVAVVVVSYPENRLLGTFVLAHEPLRLRHEVMAPPPSLRAPLRLR